MFKPFSELSEHDKGVVADIETDMPNKHYPDDPITMPEILKGLFGGIGFGSGTPVKGSKVAGTPVSSGKVAIPTDAIPVGVPVDDFAKRVAHYVVEELIERLTR